MEERRYKLLLKLLDETPEHQRKLLRRRLWSDEQECGCALGHVANRLDAALGGVHSLLCRGSTIETRLRFQRVSGLTEDEIETLIATNDEFGVDADNPEVTQRARFVHVRAYVAYRVDQEA